ncbi:MAG TPA: rhodanese-like domain-containing protein [Vicinamibacterales bacterium]
MLIAFALAAALAAPPADPIVSTDWLQAHLNDRNVRVVDVSDEGTFKNGHIAGAVFVDHMVTIGDGHKLLPADALAKLWAKAGVSDDTRVVLYGDSPMATGWMYMTLAVIGHGEQVSMLDGGLRLWESQKREVSKAISTVAPGTLSVHPAPDVMVDAAYVRARLEAPNVKILDVRTNGEYAGGHLPGSTLILWQNLFADTKTMKFKPRDEIRALLTAAGVTPGQEAITYCAVGMRASLMYFAARAVGVPARVYVGSWQDWSHDSMNPIAK